MSESGVWIGLVQRDGGELNASVDIGYERINIAHFNFHPGLKWDHEDDMLKLAFTNNVSIFFPAAKNSWEDVWGVALFADNDPATPPFSKPFPLWNDDERDVEEKLQVAISDGELVIFTDLN